MDCALVAWINCWTTAHNQDCCEWHWLLSRHVNYQSMVYLVDVSSQAHATTIDKYRL